MTEKLDLEAIRREIDEADSNLINAFERRLQAVLRVAEYKKQNNLPVRDRARELKVIEKAQGKLRNKNYAPAVAGLMEEIMAIARKMEEQQISAEPVETVPLEVGCFGVEGSYSHKAMEEYLKTCGCQDILIEVFGYNERAIQFYEKMGYHTRMIEMTKKIAFWASAFSIDLVDSLVVTANDYSSIRDYCKELVHGQESNNKD